MKKTLILLLLLTWLLSGCGTSSQQDSSTNTTSPPSSQNGSALPGGADTPQNEPQPSQPASTDEQTQETIGPDCYGDQIHPIGQSIADLYPDQTDYEQVMVWFCNGFEFEDIMTALQTSEDSDLPADQLLAKFEHGQSWEEIWVELGIIEP